MERTWEQKKADEHEKAKEHERLDGEYQVLARETADLRSFLTHINRLLDDPDNDASQLEMQQDIKVTHERMISRNEDLMAEKMRFMKWLRKPDEDYMKWEDAPKAGSADESSAANKYESEMYDEGRSSFKVPEKNGGTEESSWK
ncbi:hypothetical protein HO133_005865 [Letharia lupina]|uniref:Uncharacterized protein n=1 Tax=Letharia lupina TaxID=560253 RepID=A0A8H6C8E7_9LECA|nr:uncharacterized protein HO133_005865 [Letharia lupina]KAF6218516.1 hypothetical protein HO133_005865 [Letharia lupina]